MAIVSAQLFFRGNREYKVGAITFDLIISESHNLSNTVTEHDVEDGSRISDHIRNNLENGALVGLITNFSLKVNGLLTNRSQDAFDAINRLWKSRELVTIVTVLKVYENVAITDISIDRSESTGEAIAMNVTFRQIKQVKLKTAQIDLAVNIKDMNNDTNRQATPPTDVGRTVAPSKQTTPIRSTRGVGGTF